jgi:hypothetical protein
VPVDQVVQVAASLCILVPFVLVQVGRMSASTGSYLALNVLGATTLAVDAAISREWGFLMLEGVWALVSGIGLMRIVRTTGTSSAEAVRIRQ